MPTEVTVAPTLGHAVLATQGGVGATPGYDAIDLRRMIEAASGPQEGVYDATGWRVRETTTGPNMQVQVDANVGLAKVRGRSVTFQSDYVVAPHSGIITLDVPAAHSTNPRVDTVGLQVRDNTHDALGQNDARVVYLAGTATAGADLTNMNGSPSLTGLNIVRLADVIVPAADTTIANAQIRDRRLWAKGALAIGVRTTALNLPNLANTAPADLDVTNWKHRIECSGGPVRLSFGPGSATLFAGNNATLRFRLDGADLTSSQGILTLVNNSTANMIENSAFAVVFTPTAGSHLFSMAGQYQGGSSAASIAPATFTVEELIKQNANNGIA